MQISAPVNTTLALTDGLINALNKAPLMVLSSLCATILLLLIFVVFVRAIWRTNLDQLFQDNANGEMSSTKFWMNIAYFAATLCFIATNMLSPNAGADSSIWLIYLGVVASNAVASKWLSLRYSNTSSGDGTSIPPPAPAPVTVVTPAPPAPAPPTQVTASIQVTP